jgi:hypothetical protein
MVYIQSWMNGETCSRMTRSLISCKSTTTWIGALESETCSQRAGEGPEYLSRMLQSEKLYVSLYFTFNQPRLQIVCYAEPRDFCPARFKWKLIDFSMIHLVWRRVGGSRMSVSGRLRLWQCPPTPVPICMSLFPLICPRLSYLNWYSQYPLPVTCALRYLLLTKT